MTNHNNPAQYNNYIEELLDYYNTYKPLAQETGDFLREVAPYNPKLYSNDLRHQYASAVMAQKFGQDKARLLGNLNEYTDFGQSGRYDSKIDQFNNKVGREYAIMFPNANKKEMLNILFSNYDKTKSQRLKELGF